MADITVDIPPIYSISDSSTCNVVVLGGYQNVLLGIMSFQKNKPYFLDILPDYIPFTTQCQEGSGLPADPTGDITIRIWEEDSDTFASTEITGSPFALSKLNSKTGYYGVHIAKSLLSIRKNYRVLYEATVNGLDVAEEQILNIYNATDFYEDEQ